MHYLLLQNIHSSLEFYNFTMILEAQILDSQVLGTSHISVLHFGIMNRFVIL